MEGKNKPVKKKAGRPKGAGGIDEKPYTEEHEKWAYKFALLGLTDERIAEQFEIGLTTLEKWKTEHPEFYEALKNGRDRADTNVTYSLYQSAIGYKTEQEKVFIHNGKIIKTTVTEHYAPNPTAAIFWLKNRQKAVWRDKHDVELSGADITSVTIKRKES